MFTTKTPKKKAARKPLDEFAEIKALVRREIKRIERKLDIVDERCEEIAGYESMRRTAQELDAKKEEQGKWAPKVGDKLFWIPQSRVVTVRHVLEMGLFQIAEDTEILSIDEVRPATPEEIESSAYGERDGLEEGDSVKLTPSVKQALEEIELPLFAHDTLTWHANKSVKWKAGLITGTNGQDSDMSAKQFIRLAKLTSEKLRAAREEQEAKKPLKFGDHVQDKEGNKYRSVCDGADENGRCWVMNERLYLANLDRSALTVLKN